MDGTTIDATEAAKAVATEGFRGRHRIIAPSPLAKADDKAALSMEVRQTRAADLQAELLEAERGECELIWRAIGERLPIEHRADCAPAAILGVALRTAPITASGTSPEHCFDTNKAVLVIG
jgi:hypothetical protein